MFKTHVTTRLSAYHHDELPPRERVRVEAHLEGCAGCRAAYDEIRYGAQLASSLSTSSISSAPESIWADVSASRRARSRPWGLKFAAAGVTALMVVAVSVALVRYRPARPSWEVVSEDGSTNVGRLRAGEAFETGATSQAFVKIADIGSLTMEPNTRIRLLVTGPEQHRIALDRGKVQAVTLAPPRLFLIETPSATAIDLGCAYTLEVGEDGSSLLHVTSGLVALDRDNRETVVPAGAYCRTRPGSGPGTPFYEDSSSQLQRALDYIDSEGEKNGPEYGRQFEIVFRESRVRDSLSLWYLIPRVDAEWRGLIYDRLAQLLPPPGGVTRKGVSELDPAMLAAWEQIVTQLWQ